MRTVVLPLALLSTVLGGCGGPRIVRYAPPVSAAPSTHLAVPSGHGDELRAFTFGADGRLFATGGSGGTLRLWDTSTGVELRSFVLPSVAVTAIAISADGRRIAAATANPHAGLHVFDATNGAPIVSLFDEDFDDTKAIALDTTGHRLAVVSYPGVDLWDATTGERLAKLGNDEDTLFTFGALRLAFVADDTRLVAWGSTAWSVDLASNVVSKELAGVGTSVVRLTNNGLFSGGLGGRGEAWAGLVVPSKLVAGTGASTSLEIELPASLDVKDTDLVVIPTPDARQLVAHVARGRAMVIGPKGELRTLGEGVDELAVSPTAELVALRTKELVRVVEVASGAERFRVVAGTGATRVRFSADGKTLLHTDDRGVRAWDLAGGGLRTVREANFAELLPGAPWAIERTKGGVVFTELWGARRVAIALEENTSVHGADVDEARGRIVLSAAHSHASGMDTFYACFDLEGRELWRRPFDNLGLEARFTPDGARVIAPRYGAVAVIDAATGAVLKDTERRLWVPKALSPDGSIGVWDAWLGGVTLFPTDSDEKIGELEGDFEDASAATFSADGRTMFLAGNTSSTVGIVDAKTGVLTKQLAIRGGRIAALAVSPDGRWLAATGADGAIHMVDIPLGREVITLAALGSDWVAATPDGRFDGSPGGTAKVAWVSGDRVIRLDGTFERFFTPKLVPLALGGVGGVAERAERAFAELPSFAVAPEVRIVSPAPGTVVQSENVEVRVSARDLGGGIDEVRVRLNGKVLGESTRGLKKSGDALVLTVALAPGENEISATGFSRDRTESAPSRVVVKREAPAATARLFAIIVGINDYVNPKLRLNYGRVDAEAVAAALKTHAQRIFASVDLELLVDGKVTKDALENSFAKIARAARPEDAFVFFYAGHGVMSEAVGSQPGDFFLVPADVLQLYGKDEVLVARGLGSARLRELTTAIAAQKQLILLDACQSGGAVERFAMRGAAEEKAIAQLARSAGIAVLAASGTEQLATEVKELGHGVFTYALLEALDGKADGGQGDGKITVKEIEAFLADRVPELTAKHRGERQYPNSYSRGQDFPLGLSR